MKKIITRFILKVIGWKVINHIPAGTQKCVVTMAPHTSNWDFLLGWLGYSSLGIKSTYLIKKEAFFFPLGALLKALGAIPVDRKSKNNVVHQVVEMFNKSESMFLTITPEGTRSLSRNWKRGYYYIAENAGVPIAFGFLDYKEKVGGIGQMLTPRGDYEADLKVMEAFYADKNPLHPEKFSLSPQNR
jgi:1-acyl-sn-glycerol-3-phosphate acyltransferase